MAGTAWLNTKLPPPCPTSKTIAAPPRLGHVRTDLALLVHDRRPARHVREGVREDVARPQVGEQQVLERQRRRVPAEVDHHGHAGQPAGLDGARDRIPLRPGVVRHLDADDEVAVLADAHGGEAGVHVAEVLLDGPALHARAHDVDEREHARARPVDDLHLELREVAPSGAADVHERRLAAPERVAVGRHRAPAVAQVRVVLGAVEHVRVDVDEPRHDEQVRGVGHAFRARRVDALGDLDDPAAGDGDIPDGVDAVARVDHVSPANQQVDGGLRGHGGCHQPGARQDGGESKSASHGQGTSCAAVSDRAV
jgi:hypothetical protein